MQTLDLVQVLGAAAAAAAPANGAAAPPATDDVAAAFGALVSDALARSAATAGADGEGVSPTTVDEAEHGDEIDPSAMALLVSVLAPVPVTLPAATPVASDGDAPRHAATASIVDGIGGSEASLVTADAAAAAAGAASGVVTAPAPQGQPVTAAPIPAREGADAAAAPVVTEIAAPPAAGMPPAPVQPSEDRVTFTAPPATAPVPTPDTPPAPVRVAPAGVAVSRVLPSRETLATVPEAMDAPVPPGVDVASPTAPSAPVASATPRPDPQAQPSLSADPVRALARELARLTSTPTAPASETTGVVGPGIPSAGATGTGAGTDSGNPERGDPQDARVLTGAVQASTTAAIASGPEVASLARAAVPDPPAPVGVPAGIAAPVAIGAGAGEPPPPDAIALRSSHIEALLGSTDPDRQNVHGIVRAMRVVASADGASEARLRLEPEHLGHVALNIRVEQGSVSAHFQTENPEAQRWIETHQQELRSALRQQGLEVKELVVSSADPDRRQQQSRQPEREQPRRLRRDGTASWDSPRFEVLA